jgi:YesN/AraC family two-component response regulator
MMSNNCKLLIADDEFWVRENLKSLLDWKSLSINLIEPAINGEDALCKIKAEKPNILITDVNMPFISGTELIKQAKELYPAMQAIVLSGYSDFSYVREALLYGAIDYLLKPVTKSAIVDVLNKALSIIGSNRAHEMEQNSAREKMLMASSILRDGKLSYLISGDSPKVDIDDILTELELQYAAFTLMIIHLNDLPAALNKYKNDMAFLSFNIKNTIEKVTQNSQVAAFHNNYVRSEFILITAIDTQEINGISKKLLNAITNLTGSSVNISISNNYYSFDSLRRAYYEAHFALLTCRLGSINQIISIKDSESLSVHRRITPEQDKCLAFAIHSHNMQLAREVIFNQVKMQDCEKDGWSFIEAKQTAEHIVGMITHEIDENQSSHMILAIEILNDLLNEALESHNMPEASAVTEQILEEAFGEQTVTGVSNSMKKTVLQVKKYVDENYFEDLSLSSVARQFWVDRSYLSKAFKQVTGSNFILYISKERINKAAEYILKSSLSLLEISNLAGFEDYAYFNRVFRKIMGVSPSEYRASVQNKRKEGKP